MLNRTMHHQHLACHHHLNDMKKLYFINLMQPSGELLCYQQKLYQKLEN